MLYSPSECERLTSTPDKATAIIATSQAPLKWLVWSVLSLLLRSTPDVLSDVVVVINGPDERTGDPTLQDRKQRFLEGLRRLPWRGLAAPLTVVRTWGRVGAGKSWEQAIPWVHTQHYLLVHDDAILLAPRWQEEAKDFFGRENVAMRTHGPHWCWPLAAHENRVRFPHTPSPFVLCKKAILAAVGARWLDYGVNVPCRIGEDAYRGFVDFWRRHGMDFNPDAYHRGSEPLAANHEYAAVCQEAGAWVLYLLAANGYAVDRFSDDLLFHYRAASWAHDRTIDVTQPGVLVDALEREIEAAGWGDLYRRHLG
jgi:hypothetical protein